MPSTKLAIRCLLHNKGTQIRLATLQSKTQCIHIRDHLSNSHARPKLTHIKLLIMVACGGMLVPHWLSDTYAFNFAKQTASNFLQYIWVQTNLYICTYKENTQPK